MGWERCDLVDVDRELTSGREPLRAVGPGYGLIWRQAPS